MHHICHIYNIFMHTYVLIDIYTHINILIFLYFEQNCAGSMPKIRIHKCFHFMLIKKENKKKRECLLLIYCLV